MISVCDVAERCSAINRRRARGPLKTSFRLQRLIRFGWRSEGRGRRGCGWGECVGLRHADSRRARLRQGSAGRLRCGCYERVRPADGWVRPEEDRETWGRQRCGEGGRFAGRDSGRSMAAQLHGHGAMVRAVTAAAGGQARIVGWTRSRPRRGRSPKNRTRKIESSAAHLRLMVHEQRREGGLDRA